MNLVGCLIPELTTKKDYLLIRLQHEIWLFCAFDEISVLQEVATCALFNLAHFIQCTDAETQVRIGFFDNPIPEWCCKIVYCIPGAKTFIAITGQSQRHRLLLLSVSKEHVLRPGCIFCGMQVREKLGLHPTVCETIRACHRTQNIQQES
jgi:hypothetical protein